MEDVSELKQSLQNISDAVKDALKQLKDRELTNPDTVLTNATLNNNVNQISFTTEENEQLILLTEKLEHILKNTFPSLNEKSRKYLFNMLHDYHYDHEEKKFQNSLTMNHLHSFLNDVESTRSSLDAFKAAWDGEVTPVREFIKNYPQFKDKPGIFGTTLLYSAARNNRMQVVDYLVTTAHCSINAQNEQHVEKALTKYPVTSTDFIQAPTAGSTALHGACYYEHLDIVKYLLAHGADYYITNHINETPIKNAEQSERIVEFFKEYLILGYSIVTDSLPEKPILEGGQATVKDCIWEYKPLSDRQWYGFSPTEGIELSESLSYQPDEEFQEEIHLNVRRGVYSVSTIRFLRSGKDLDNKQNLAWIRCRGSSILNFDCYSLWQIMFIHYPSMDTNCLASLEILNIPSLIDLTFKIQANAWYNCPQKVSLQLDKAMNYRQKILPIKLSFINDQFIFNLYEFTFTNNDKTIVGYIRWIPKLISNNALNNNKILNVDNFKATTNLNPIPMRSIHQKQTKTENDENLLIEAGEHEMSDDINDDEFSTVNDDEDDNYEGNLTDTHKTTSASSPNNGTWSINDVLQENDSTTFNQAEYRTTTTDKPIDVEPENKIEDYINESNAAVTVEPEAAIAATTNDQIDTKFEEAQNKIKDLEETNDTLIAQIQTLTMQDEERNEKHERELAELFSKMEQLSSQREKLEKEQKNLKEEQQRSKQIKNSIRSIKYQNIKSQLIEQYLFPNHNLLINYLQKGSIQTHNDDEDFIKNFPKIDYEQNLDTYTILITGFQNHHEQFKKIFQIIQSLFNSVQSAKEYYERELNRNRKSLMKTFSQVSCRTRFWILYMKLFSTNLQERIKEYLSEFKNFIQDKTKDLIEKCITEQITKPWIDIKKLTNQFLAENSFFQQIDLIKYQTMELFIQQNISYQRIKTDKKPTEQSALIAKQMIDNILDLFKSEQQYKGYELKHLQLIPLLLQRIHIYYSCFTLQLPLFESADDLLRKIQNNTVTTITTTTGSGKSTLLPPLLIAEGYDRVIVTQPRRLPCQLISRRVNETMTIDNNTKREDLAGWIVSGAKLNPDAKILYMTDGLLRERLLYDDNIVSKNSQLKKGFVIFLDEVHERSINIDLCLAFLARLLTNQPSLKTKLKLIISSATLDESVPNLFRHIPQISLVEFALPQMKTLYTVEKRTRSNANILDVAQELYKKCQRNDQILCFVNSALDATQYCKLLSDITKGAINARPLIQSQSPKIQQKNIEEATVLFSTTIAETSLTFPSLKYVIDSGYINLPIYDAKLKRTILTTVQAAHSTIKQRLGRVGRTKPGEYYALYDFDSEKKPYPQPQICLADLTNIEFSLRRSPLKCGLNIIQRFLPDKPSQDAINYTVDTLRTLKILESAPSDQFTNLGKALAKIPDFGTLQMSLSVLAALRDFNCGHDLICLASILGVLNTTAVFTSIPARYKSSDGDFMTLLNIMDSILLIKQSVPSHQFNLDRICEAKQLTGIRHVLGPALRRYMSLEKSFNLSNDYREQAHLKSGNWEYIAKALLTGYSDNVFISSRELQEKKHLFSRAKDSTDIAMLDLKSILTKSLKDEPVPVVIVRDVLYSTAVRSRAIITFAGEIKFKWMEYPLQRQLNLTDEEQTYLNGQSRYTKVRSLYSDNIQMQLQNKTVSLRGPSGVVLNAEVHLRKEMINTIKFPLQNRHTQGTTAYENLSRNLTKVRKMPNIFHPMIWRWKLEKQVEINVNTTNPTIEVTVKGRDSEIIKVKKEFDSFMSWLDNCAVLGNPDAGVSPRILRPPMRTQCIDIEERIEHITDSKRTRVDLHNGVKGHNATRETRMEVVAWIAVCKFNCKLEGGFVRDWIVGKSTQRPTNSPTSSPTNPSGWIQYQGVDQIPYMIPQVVPSDLDCHLPKNANFDIEKFQDELHKYDIKCKVYRQHWRYILLIDIDEKTGPFTMDLIEPHVAITHDRIDFDVNNLYVEKDYTRELGMRVDIQHKPYSIELESIVNNIKKKQFRILRPVDNFLQIRVDKMINRGWTQLGQPFTVLPSPDPQYCSVLVPLPPTSVLYKDLSAKIGTIDTIGTIGTIGRVTIKSIEQIKNPLLEDAYEAMKSLIARQCPGSNPNERELFHGTKEKGIQGITDYGFDDRYFSSNGRWGHGAYFADDPRKSHSYTAPDSNDGTRVIFYAKVLLGEISVQNTDDKKLVSAPIDHHSVNGTGGTYEEYIVYRYGQALPYIKITYK